MARGQKIIISIIVVLLLIGAFFIGYHTKQVPVTVINAATENSTLAGLAYEPFVFLAAEREGFYAVQFIDKNKTKQSFNLFFDTSKNISLLQLVRPECEAYFTGKNLSQEQVHTCFITYTSGI